LESHQMKQFVIDGNKVRLKSLDMRKGPIHV
jgi:hypothetical protein